LLKKTGEKTMISKTVLDGIKGEVRLVRVQSFRKDRRERRGHQGGNTVEKRDFGHCAGRPRESMDKRMSNIKGEFCFGVITEGRGGSQ